MFDKTHSLPVFIQPPGKKSKGQKDKMELSTCTDPVVTAVIISSTFWASVMTFLICFLFRHRKKKQDEENFSTLSPSRHVTKKDLVEDIPKTEVVISVDEKECPTARKYCIEFDQRVGAPKRRPKEPDETENKEKKMTSAEKGKATSTSAPGEKDTKQKRKAAKKQLQQQQQKNSRKQQKASESKQKY